MIVAAGVALLVAAAAVVAVVTILGRCDLGAGRPDRTYTRTFTMMPGVSMLEIAASAADNPYPIRSLDIVLDAAGAAGEIKTDWDVWFTEDGPDEDGRR